jgi:hypothetical protein
LAALWLDQMQTFTGAAIAQITADPSALRTLSGQDRKAWAGPSEP